MSRNNNIRIGNETIKDLQYESQNYRVWDDKIIGFGISVQKQSRSYIVQYRNKYGKQCYYTFGRVDNIAPDDARKIAKKLFAQIALGEDPATKRDEDKNSMTIGKLCDWYMKDGMGHKKPKTQLGDKAMIENHIKPLIGPMPIKTITRGALAKFASDVEKGEIIKRREKSKNPRGLIVVRGGVSAATHSLGLLGTIFEFAKSHDIIENNPARGIKRPPKNKRDI